MKNRELGKVSEFGLLGSILLRESMVNSFMIPVVELAFNGGKLVPIHQTSSIL